MNCINSKLIYCKPVVQFWNNIRELRAMIVCRSCVFIPDSCPDDCWILKEFWLSDKWMYDIFRL